jgi:hypothetical protein
MNDPGTAEPMQEANDELKKVSSGDVSVDEDEVHNFIDPREFVKSASWL